MLQHGGLLAVLSFLDFFPTGVQRVAVATAANMCRGLGADHASAVKEAVPMLSNLLQYQVGWADNRLTCFSLSLSESVVVTLFLVCSLSVAGPQYMWVLVSSWFGTVLAFGKPWTALTRIQGREGTRAYC